MITFVGFSQNLESIIQSFLELETKSGSLVEDGTMMVHVSRIDRSAEKVRIQFESC